MRARQSMSFATRSRPAGRGGAVAARQPSGISQRSCGTRTITAPDGGGGGGGTDQPPTTDPLEYVEVALRRVRTPQPNYARPVFRLAQYSDNWGIILDLLFEVYDMNGNLVHQETQPGVELAPNEGGQEEHELTGVFDLSEDTEFEFCVEAVNATWEDPSNVTR